MVDMEMKAEKRVIIMWDQGKLYCYLRKKNKRKLKVQT